MYQNGLAIVTIHEKLLSTLSGVHLEIMVLGIISEQPLMKKWTKSPLTLECRGKFVFTCVVVSAVIYSVTIPTSSRSANWD